MKVDRTKMPVCFMCCFSVVSPRICTNSVEKKFRVFVLIVNWIKLEPDEVRVHGDLLLK